MVSKLPPFAFVSICIFLTAHLTRENTVQLIHANRHFQSLNMRTGLRLSDILNMISENASISKLIVNAKYTDVSRSELNQFISARASIVELRLNCHLFTADDAAFFVDQLKKLKKFEFRLNDHSECDHFLIQLHKKWQPLNKKWYYRIRSIRDEEDFRKMYYYITLICKK